MKEKIRDLVMKISMEERKKRRDAVMRGEKAQLEQMPDEELLFTCISLQAAYERQKQYFTFELVVFAMLAAYLWELFSFWQMAKTTMMTLANTLLFSGLLVMLALLVYLIGQMLFMRAIHRNFLLAMEVAEMRGQRKAGDAHCAEQ